MHPSSHGTHRGGCSSNQVCSRVVVAQTLCPSRNPLWLLPLRLREGQSVCATTTREHNWFEEQNYRGCGDDHTWLAERSMAGIGLSPWCAVWRRVHTLNICRYVSETCWVTLSFLLVFIILFTILVNIINFKTAPIILIHPVLERLNAPDNVQSEYKDLLSKGCW